MDHGVTTPCALAERQALPHGRARRLTIPVDKRLRLAGDAENGASLGHALSYQKHENTGESGVKGFFCGVKKTSPTSGWYPEAGLLNPERSDPPDVP
jgi:hypothetical protein